jgi:polyisoprenoid-binding protein YceI
MRKTLTSLAALSALLTLPALAETSEWAIDASHSRFGFSVPHMMVTDVDGSFKKATGKILLDEANLTKSTVELTIDAASIDTGEADRDKHLKSADFLDVEKHPTITFKSTKIQKAGKAYKVTGDLAIRGVTKPVTLEVELSDARENPWGKQVRGAKVRGKINRQDFGVSWNKSLDKGGVLVGDTVSFDIKLELSK